MDQRMNEAVKVAIQIQFDRLRDEAQADNDEVLKTIDENMQKIIKEEVKEQVKVQVSKILPKIEQTVNEQLEAKVLTRSSNSSETSYTVAVDLSEMELKKILINKIEGNKSIHRSNEQRNLCKALVDAYEFDKIILDTYGDIVTLKRHRDDDADKDEEPSAGSDRGSKRRREGKEPESASAPTKKATRSADKSTQGSRSRQTSASEFATTEEPMQTTFEMEEPSHLEDEESFDPIPKTPENSDDEGNGEENLETNVGREEGHNEEEDELYRDVNINLGRGIQTTQEFEDSYVNLTPINPDGQQQSSSVSSQFVTSMLNPTPDAGMKSIFETTSQMDVQIPTSMAPLPMSAPTLTPSTFATITQQALTPPTTAPSTLLQDLPNFGSLFGFDNRLRTLEANFSEFMQTNQFAGAVMSILGIVHRYMDQRINEAVKTIDENMQKIIKEQVKEQVKMELKKILIEKMEGNKSIQRSNKQRNLYKAFVEAYKSDKIILDTYKDTVTLKRCHDDDADKDEEPSAGSDRGSKRRREGKEPESASAPHEKATRSAGKSTQGSKSRQTSASNIQPWISELAKQSDSRSSFNELMGTPVDFSNFLLNRLKVDTLTPELLAGPTYELMKESCKSLVELEFHLDEVYKATTDQLDWVNPEGQQYPHNLLKPLPLIPNNRGCRVIPFDHFINNDLAYLRGGASCRKYTTSVTKTKATYYEHIKWIKDLFYGFAINQESARDVYSKRRIIAVTELKISGWHNYKNLDWIMVRRDDDKLYKLKEGDFKRLRIQDIEDMLLLLVQGKLTNLSVEERFAFNVSLRMFTRSIVIQRRVEDLQLDVESYQKKLNLTRPNTYHSDLKRKEAYGAYSNPRGFIYQNKDKKNRLMRIDELQKFSGGTLTDVRTALDDCLKGIWMQYLPQSIWRKSDKDRAATMIQALIKC
nr:hypothetical protein [Tanacetum cinerariifolium]